MVVSTKPQGAKAAKGAAIVTYQFLPCCSCRTDHC